MCCLVWLLIQNIKNIIIKYIFKFNCFKKRHHNIKIISLPYDSKCCGKCERINDYIRGWTFIEILPNHDRIISNKYINCNGK
uniref:Uncharacterized protein n=1 Tax=Strongyloides stercoralis TaxID=6248 RepID=A0A0K0ECH0_STRER